MRQVVVGQLAARQYVVDQVQSHGRTVTHGDSDRLIQGHDAEGALLGEVEDNVSAAEHHVNSHGSDVLSQLGLAAQQAATSTPAPTPVPSMGLPPETSISCTISLISMPWTLDRRSMVSICTSGEMKESPDRPLTWLIRT